jgi:hypothetical protein
MRIQEDPDPDIGQTFEKKKVEFFYMKNILKVGNRSKAENQVNL